MSTLNQTTEALVINRVFDAPRELVWKAWTQPEYLKRWWGPKNFTAPVCKINLHVGGEYLYCMRSPEGKEFWSKGIFNKIIEPEKLAYTDSFADEKGNTVSAQHYGMPGDWPVELYVTVTFREQDGKTKMTVMHEGLPDEMKEMCYQGWNESFDKLAESLK